MSFTIALVIFVAAVFLNALFSGYETGLVQLNPIRIRYLAEAERHAGARRLLRHLERREDLITTLLIGNNLTLMLGTMMLTDAIENLEIAGIHGTEIIATLISLPAFLILGETLPKSMFRTHPNRLSLWFLPVIRVFHGLLAPLSVPATYFARAMLRATGQEPQSLRPVLSSLEDMRVLVDESAAHGTLEPDERKMIHSVMNLQSKLAKEIMVPRIDIQALPDTATRQELVALFEASGRTRIPVFHETIDRVVGAVRAYDVLTDDAPECEDITRFVKDVLHVPDTMTADDLLQQMKRDKQQLVIVTDEYGGTDGLITLEDVLEEIFGEIQDEHDREQRPIHRVGPDAYVIDARMSLEEAAQALGVVIRDEEVETVGGWLQHVAGRIPAQGEVVLYGGFRMTVLEGHAHSVSKIRLELLPEARRKDERTEGGS